MKQTAVEKMIQYFIEQKNNGASHWCIDDLIAQLHQAKAMEKEQIKDAFVQCWKSNVPDGIECKLDAEQYYNETFKSE
ncbi:MAG: hypothetical protein EBU53_01385 [Proteobacteria bacterium]|nr:hypothetical protein [Pseudomonadota bacterium]